MKKCLVIVVALISFACATTAPDGEKGRDPLEDDRCGTGTCGGSH